MEPTKKKYNTVVNRVSVAMTLSIPLNQSLRAYSKKTHIPMSRVVDLALEKFFTATGELTQSPE
jgi:hypothetical protein